MLTADAFYDALPFLLGIVLIAMQKGFDHTWQDSYKRLRGINGDEALETPLPEVIWSADVAAFTPAAYLTLAGFALLLAAHIARPVGWIIGVLLAGALAIWTLYNKAARPKECFPGKPAFWLSKLQWTLVVFNAAGLVIALVTHRTS